tara:strand:+ start:103 stop:432 length:330 start_codon:yes stop_codon:yes gene_type:complete
MKVLIKIEKYFPETKQIVVKFCSSQSEKSIDKVEALSFDLSNFNLQDTELFLESLAIRGQDIVDNYEQLQHGEYIDNGPLDISSLVGKTIEREKFPRNKKMIPMRKIKL